MGPRPRCQGSSGQEGGLRLRAPSRATDPVALFLPVPSPRSPRRSRKAHARLNGVLPRRLRARRRLVGTRQRDRPVRRFRPSTGTPEPGNCGARRITGMRLQRTPREGHCERAHHGPSGCVATHQSLRRSRREEWLKQSHDRYMVAPIDSRDGPSVAGDEGEPAVPPWVTATYRSRHLERHEHRTVVRHHLWRTPRCQRRWPSQRDARASASRCLDPGARCNRDTTSAVRRRVGAHSSPAIRSGHPPIRPGTTLDPWLEHGSPVGRQGQDGRGSGGQGSVGESRKNSAAGVTHLWSGAGMVDPSRRTTSRRP